MKNIKTLFALALGLCCMKNSFAQGVTLSYKDGNTNLQGYLMKSRDGAPGIVIIHQWMGLSQHEKNSANKLASLGYNALAADIYGEGIRPKNTEEAAKLAGSYKKDYKLFQSRIKAAIAELIKQGADSSKIAVMGYCFGGTGAIEAARGLLPISGAISFHGSLMKDKARPNGPIKTKVLVLHGADDPYESEQEIKDFQQEMREAKADWEMIYYANAVHAFTQIEAGNDNSKGAAYNAIADKRSWERLRSFLVELFGVQIGPGKRFNSTERSGSAPGQAQNAPSRSSSAPATGTSVTPTHPSLSRQTSSTPTTSTTNSSPAVPAPVSKKR